MSQVFLSNRLENLLTDLQTRLFSSSEFQKKSVVVASRGMKRWIKGKLLASRGCFFGIELLTLGEFLAPSLPSLEELTIKIFGYLETFPEVLSYLEGKDAHKKKDALALHLASLFLSYHQLGFTPEESGWQKDLFEKVFYSNPIIFPTHEIFFFGFSHLPQPAWEAIQENKAPLYLVSPTEHFWEDLKKGEHPLLGNLGRMGRVMASRLKGDEEKIYSLPQSIALHPIYAPHLLGDEGLENGPLTLLKAVQSDLLLMRHGEEKTSLSFDQTVEVHVAFSKEREVEVLKERIFSLMTNEGISPGEILVMAKDISPYLPLLKAHFEREDYPFKVVFEEVGAALQSPSWILLKDLLQLRLKRFHREHVLSFFSSEMVKRTLHLSQDDLKDLTTLVEEGAIFWGWSKEERQHERGSAFPTGTWSEGFQRLTQKILSFEKKDIPLKDPLPLSFSESLGIWIERLEKLYSTLSLTTSSEQRPLQEWSLFLGHLIETYLGEEGEMLEEALSSLSTDSEEKIPFSLFFTLFERNVEKIQTSAFASHWDAILFTSLGPMRAVPKRIVYLLGMEEESFPSKEPPLFGDLSLHHPDRISLRDQDRYAFLETLLSARERLIISYSTPLLMPPEKGEASPALQALITILDNNYLLDGSTFSQRGVFIHPRSRFENVTSELDHSLLYPTSQPRRLKNDLSLPQEVTIKELLTFARDPAQAFYKAHFNTSLPWFKPELPSTEPFGLTKELSRKMPPALEVSFEGRAYQQGLRLKEEQEEKEKDAFWVYFSRDCQRALQNEEGDWVLPALQIDNIHITGALGPLTKNEGLIAETSKDEKYPLLLLSSLLPFSLPSAVPNPEEALRDYLATYTSLLNTPLPLAKEKESLYSDLIPEVWT